MNHNRLVGSYARVEYSHSHFVEPHTEVLPYLANNAKFLEESSHSTPVYGWVRGAVVKEGNEGREVSLGVVVLDDGKERVDGVVDLSVRSGSQLVHGEGVVGFRVLGESVEDDPFEEFFE